MRAFSALTRRTAARALCAQLRECDDDDDDIWFGSLERNFGISPTLFKELAAAAAAVAVFPCSVKWLYGLQICWFDQINYEAEGFALPWRGSDLLIMCSRSDPITQWTWISLSWEIWTRFQPDSPRASTYISILKRASSFSELWMRHRTSYKLCNHEARRPHKSQSQQSVFPRIIKFLIRKKNHRLSTAALLCWSSSRGRTNVWVGARRSRTVEKKK